MGEMREGMLRGVVPGWEGLTVCPRDRQGGTCCQKQTNAEKRVYTRGNSGTG